MLFLHRAFITARSGAVLRAIGKFFSSGFLPLFLASPSLPCAPPPHANEIPTWGAFRAGFSGVCNRARSCVCERAGGGGCVEEVALRGRTEASLFIYYLWKSLSVMKLPPKGRGGKDRTLLSLAACANQPGAGPVRQLVPGC